MSPKVHFHIYFRTDVLTLFVSLDTGHSLGLWDIIAAVWLKHVLLSKCIFLSVGYATRICYNTQVLFYLKFILLCTIEPKYGKCVESFLCCKKCYTITCPVVTICSFSYMKTAITFGQKRKTKHLWASFPAIKYFEIISLSCFTVLELNREVLKLTNLKYRYRKSLAVENSSIFFPV